MSLVAEILDRLSGVTTLKERLGETNRNVERSLAWLLDHEKRLIRLESAAPPAPPAAIAHAPAPRALPRKPRK